MERVDRRLDPQVRARVVAQHLADEHAADFARRVARATRDRAIERLLGEEHAELRA